MTETPATPARVVLLSLGSNIEPEQNLLEALDEIDTLLGVVAVSSFYEGEPVGAPNTPRFLNAAVAVETDATPESLKYEVIRPLEARMGRQRSDDPNAPRTIDIDVAAVEGLVALCGDPKLPDPDISKHAHLAVPLGEVAPDFLHPLEGVPLSAIAARFQGSTGIWKREDIEWPRP